MNLRSFKSATTRTAENNLCIFIGAAQSANPFRVVWGDRTWKTRKKARASRRGNEVIRFWRHLYVSPARADFNEPFGSFVRAVVCHREILSADGLAISRHEDMVRACRYLYEVLLLRETVGLEDDRVKISPCRLMRGDFDEAESSARVRESVGAANNISSALEILGEMMDRRGLAAVPLQWSGSRRSRDKYDRVGDAAERRRQAKLPSDEVFSALAMISSRGDLPDRDLLRQRGAEILMCCGFRINELLTLPRTTWVVTPVVDRDGEVMLDRSGRPAERVGLRYWPEKGGSTETQIKWLHSAAVEVVRRALDDITRITAPFAEAARYMVENPGRTVLGPPWDAMPADRHLSMAEAAALLNFGSPVAMSSFVKRTAMEVRQVDLGRGRTQLAVLKGDVEAHLVRQSGVGEIVLPGGEENIALHDCLFVVPVEFFHPKNGNLRGTATIVNDGQLNAYLCGNGGTKSIFERFDVSGLDGRSLRVNSHQFRHWLNTVAQEGGLSEAEVARWMGRVSLGQNAAYDHVSPSKMARRLREKLHSGQAVGPVVEQLRDIKDPVRREEFARSAIPAAHATDIGTCLHDWSALPCDKHGACVNCEEHWLVKGDTLQMLNAERFRDDTKILLEMARLEASEDTYGADNWLAHHERALSQIGRVLEAHRDPNIPDGTPVRLRRIDN
ncbi:hypothetical protein [Roseomonas indoligenes]|uniref:Integrase n=1 Tax=Roseomonas indoligenes TaxID=2820811 RepID=A0A940N315_9PROT|nr:hypothetical protein [Pararoseomonas indoligenes]MBP0495812.1 hypothetical protein [Pararoseomonas indoligenes]